LRAIEEKIFERVGGGSQIRADVRIIASTKQNLLEKISAGTFRQDLYYRLDVLRINIPPLREHLEDVPLLAEFLLKRIAGGRPCRIDAEAAAILSRHDWPGNVRELHHTLERAFLIGAGHISAEILAAEVGGPDPNQRLPVGGFQAAIDHAEKQLLQDALRNSGGNKTAAAASLGMKPSTFRDKLAKHDLG
jgi:DNA-binding NtrC family response regulator